MDNFDFIAGATVFLIVLGYILYEYIRIPKELALEDKKNEN